MSRLILALLFVASLSAQAASIGDDGLHKQEWFALTFKDIAEDIEDAQSDGKRLVLLFEQRGCIYCTKMHEKILSDSEVSEYLQENFNIVQYNLFGDDEVTDLDGAVITEKQAAEKWGVMFTPTLMFMPEAVSGAESASAAALSTMPGAFDKYTFLHMFQFVREKAYEGDEHFQKYHARKLEERRRQGQLTENN
jgi:thioredoxin-related protein